MRWAPDARGRLERAAFELISEQGYQATTIPQITARAGLTTRTFFRHFADKREVIFSGDEIPERAARLIAAAPLGLEPIDVIRHVLHDIATTQFDGHHEQTAVWRKIINADDSLRDRDARKRADLVRTARAAFTGRGQTPLHATVIAEMGVAIFHIALEKWAADLELGPMADTIDDVIALFSVSVPAAPQRTTRIGGLEP